MEFYRSYLIHFIEHLSGYIFSSIILSCNFQELMPELHNHFNSQSFHTSMYASSWFLTLFTTALALPTACRIIDVFLSEGMEIIFKVALALLTMGKDDLLSLDMEGMLKVSGFSIHPTLVAILWPHALNHYYFCYEKKSSQLIIAITIAI